MHLSTEARGARLAAALSAAALGLSACGGDGDEVTLPPPPGGELAEVRGLGVGELAFAARPATCARTRAVVLGIARNPKPSRLELSKNGCFIYANRASGVSVSVRGKPLRYRSERGVAPLGTINLFARQASLPFGPFEVIARKEARRLSGGRTGLTENKLGSFAALGPSRPRSNPLRCVTRALRLPPAAAPLELPYTVTPGGARGAIVVKPARERPPVRPLRGQQSLRRIAELDCGRRTLAERPAGCAVTRAVVVAAGRPEPPELRLPAAGGCVVWGNEGSIEAVLDFAGADTPPEAQVAKDRRRLWPRAAVSWDFFLGPDPLRSVRPV